MTGKKNYILLESITSKDKEKLTKDLKAAFDIYRQEKKNFYIQLGASIGFLVWGIAFATASKIPITLVNGLIFWAFLVIANTLVVRSYFKLQKAKEFVEITKIIAAFYEIEINSIEKP